MIICHWHSLDHQKTAFVRTWTWTRMETSMYVAESAFIYKQRPYIRDSNYNYLLPMACSKQFYPTYALIGAMNSAFNYLTRLIL